MKTILVALILLSSKGVNASVKVDRVWEKYNHATALVTYVNEEPKTISKMVLIKCIFLDSSGKKVALGEKYVNIFPKTIPPQFSDTFEVMADLNGATYSSVDCKDYKN